MGGCKLEGFVIEQVLGHLAVSGREYQPSFLRTSDGREIDLLIDLVISGGPSRSS